MNINEATEELTLHLRAATVREIQSKVSSGRFSSADAVVEESIAQMRGVEDGLDEWIATEGVRRLKRMQDDPSRALGHEEFWSRVEAKLDAENESRSKEAA